MNSSTTVFDEILKNPLVQRLFNPLNLTHGRWSNVYLLEKNTLRPFLSLVGDISTTVKLIRYYYFLNSQTEVTGIVGRREKKEMLKRKREREKGRRE